MLQGPPDSPYEGGLYHGKLKFPDDFPFKPPSIFMLTPNGRFETGRRLCLSMSDFHPETWVPTWSVPSILNGVLSFMLETSPTTGSVETSVAEKRRLCSRTTDFNALDVIYCRLFPELIGGTLFTDLTSASVADPTSASAPAHVAPTQSHRSLTGVPSPSSGASGNAVDADTAAAEGEGEGEGEGVAGRNAAKNRRKREKAKMKAAAAPPPPVDDEPTSSTLEAEDTSHSADQPPSLAAPLRDGDDGESGDTSSNSMALPS